MNRKFSPFKGDKPLWIIIAVLCVISLLVVYSATASMAYRNVAGDTSYYVSRQAMFILMGFFITYIVHWIDVRHYIRYSSLFFKISIGLMIMAYVIGVSLNDAARWIRIPGLGITFQPADMIKITLAMMLAVQLGTRQSVINRIPILPSLSRRRWREFPRKNFDILHKTTMPLLGPVLIACAVIMPSNLSTAVIMFVSSMIVMMVGRVRLGQLWKVIWMAGVGGLVVIGAMWIMGVGRAETWVNRIETYVGGGGGGDSETRQKRQMIDFQERQAKIAIASGGAFGKGPGNSTQRSQLPHPYSDFAYAFIIEEYGLLGAILTPMLYLWIVYRARVIVYRSRRPVSGLLVMGLSLTIAISAFVHIFVSTGLFPVTGQALPLVSLGGSSMLFNSVAFGIILSVSRENREEEVAEKLAEREALRLEALAESSTATDQVEISPAVNVSQLAEIRAGQQPVAPSEEGDEDELFLISRETDDPFKSPEDIQKEIIIFNEDDA